MKTNIIKALFGLILTFTISGLYAQSPRIKLNQITKDTVKGSVLISSPSDSGMVYSRDFYIAYGADTVLILYGDTLAATSGIISSVLSDGVTITGDGTTGNELKVDTATVVSTIQGLVDTLTARNYLTANQTITLSGDVTGSGTTAITATVVDDSHNHIISNVDFLQDSLNNKTNTDFSNVSGTLPIANGGTGATSLSSANIVTGSGTTNYLPKFTSSNAIGNSNLINDASGNLGLNVSPSNALAGSNSFEIGASGVLWSETASSIYNTLVYGLNFYFDAAANLKYKNTGVAHARYVQYQGSHNWYNAPVGTADSVISSTQAMILDASGNLGIGENSPSQKLDVNGKVKIQDLTGTGGNAVYENGGVLGVASDARFKSHIADLDNGIEKILNLKPKYFIDNRNSAFQQLGFYAQEVKSVINEASYPIGNTEYLGINDRAIIAVTVKAIQEQQAIIEQQATEIQQLKTQIQLILSKIEQIKNN